MFLKKKIGIFLWNKSPNTTLSVVTLCSSSLHITNTLFLSLTPFLPGIPSQRVGLARHPARPLQHQTDTIFTSPSWKHVWGRVPMMWGRLNLCTLPFAFSYLLTSYTPVLWKIKSGEWFYLLKYGAWLLAEQLAYFGGWSSVVLLATVITMPAHQSMPYVHIFKLSVCKICHTNVSDIWY